MRSAVLAGRREQWERAKLHPAPGPAAKPTRRAPSAPAPPPHCAGNEIFSLEVRRWSPDAEARASVAVAAGADPTLMQMVQMAGLLGEEATMAERTTEYLCSGGCWPSTWAWCCLNYVQRWRGLQGGRVCRL